MLHKVTLVSIQGWHPWEIDKCFIDPLEEIEISASMELVWFNYGVR